jgi:hypothetical protein
MTTTKKNLLRDFVFENPIKIFATAVLTVGGLFVLVFFVRIGFMPDVDLTSSTALLFSVALVGLGSVISFVIMAVLPGVATQYALDESALPPDGWTIATVAAAGIFLPITIMAAVWLYEGAVVPIAPYLMLAFIVLAIGAVVWRVYHLSKTLQAFDGLPRPKVQGHAALQTIFLLGGGALAWLLGTLTALQIAIRFSAGSSHSSWLIVFVVAAWMFLLVGINVATSRLSTKQAWVFAPISGLVTLVLLTLLTGNFSELPTSAIRELGFGGMRNVDLLIKAEVCRAMPLSSSTDLRCFMSSSDSAGILRGVTILSRIGAQVVVEKSVTTSSAEVIQPAARLILKKDDVLMWMIRSDDAAAKK